MHLVSTNIKSRTSDTGNTPFLISHCQFQSHCDAVTEALNGLKTFTQLLQLAPIYRRIRIYDVRALGDHCKDLCSRVYLHGGKVGGKLCPDPLLAYSTGM